MIFLSLAEDSLAVSTTGVCTCSNGYKMVLVCKTRMC